MDLSKLISDLTEMQDVLYDNFIDSEMSENHRLAEAYKFAYEMLNDILNQKFDDESDA